MSPLLANIALSVLDDHFAAMWNHHMATEVQPQGRRRRGQANYRLIRYADDFVIVVTGEREHADGLREEAAAVLAPMGLRLAPDKTRVVHIDHGFDGGFQGSSQHLDDGGVPWLRGRLPRRPLGGSGRRIGRCGRRCVLRDVPSRRGRCRGRSGV